MKAPHSASKAPQRDERTLELPGIPRKRGRPKTGNAMTGAQRMRNLRARRAAEAKGILVTRDGNSSVIHASAAVAEPVIPPSEFES